MTYTDWLQTYLFLSESEAQDRCDKLEALGVDLTEFDPDAQVP